MTEQEEQYFHETPPTAQTSSETATPMSELEMMFITTQPAWGREAHKELDNKVKRMKRELEADGSLKETNQKLWGLLSYYTRDIRLANLNSVNGEFEYCQFYLDLAGDLLRANYVKSFLTALTRVITVLELSQSKNGFLRRRSNTITRESVGSPEPPAKSGWLGKKNAYNN